MRFALMSKRESTKEQCAEYIAQFELDSCIEIEFSSYDNGQTLLKSIEEKPPDVLFYDFEEDDKFLTTVRRIAAITATCQLVLVGDDNRNAILGYALKARDYLMTPIDEEDFLEVVARLVRESMERIQQVIPLKVGGQWSTLPANRITHVESEGHYINFHLDDGECFKTLGTHQDFARHWQLNSAFLRTHQSYVVNLDHVREVEGKNLYLNDGTHIPVSRSYLAQVKRGLTLHQLHRYQTLEDKKSLEKEQSPLKIQHSKGGKQR